jgi:hypothetical protein
MKIEENEFVIDHAEISECLKMFKRNCSALTIVKKCFMHMSYTGDKFLKIVAKHSDGELESFYFCLNFEENDRFVSLVMYDDFFEIMEEEEIYEKDGDSFKKVEWEEVEVPGGTLSLLKVC